MKSICLSIIICAFFINSYAQKKFVIEGNFKTNFNGKLMVAYLDQYKPIQVTNGFFSFKGSAKSPVEISLNILWDDKNQTNNFFIKNGESIKIVLDTVTKHKPFKRLDVKMEFVSNSSTNLLFDSISNDLKIELEKAISEKIKKQMLHDFVLRNKNNEILNVIILNKYRDLFNLEEMRAYYTNYSKHIKSTNYVKDIEQSFIKIDKLDVVIGEKIRDFTQKNTIGKPVSIQSFRGKYLLIDFWASWCPPCRRENPNLISAYHKFKDKNFEILGVSLDEKKMNWIKAIKEDSLPWMQVSDLKMFSNIIALSYNIKSIPSNILIDSNGIIIAKNLRGEELSKKLAEIFESK